MARKTTKSDGYGLDVLEVWNDIENKLRDAEKSCRTVVIPDELQLKKGKKKKKHPEEEEDRVVPWDCRTMPGAPEGIPTLLSQMSSNPERAAAFSKYSIGSQTLRLSWLYILTRFGYRLWWNVWKQGIVHVLDGIQPPNFL